MQHSKEQKRPLFALVSAAPHLHIKFAQQLDSTPGSRSPKELNKRVKLRLLEMDKDREFSDLIEYLLRKWLQGNINNG